MIGFLIAVFIVFVVFFALFKMCKQYSCPPEKMKFKFKLYFVDAYKNYNQTKFQKGDCDFEIKDGKLYIEQNGNIIEDNIFDIYNIRTWTFKEYCYIAIKMKTSSEYMFSLPIKTTAETSLEKSVLLGMLKTFKLLCTKLRIDFVECGESKGNNEDDDEINDD